jgi:hypothetical protein
LSEGSHLLSILDLFPSVRSIQLAYMRIEIRPGNREDLVRIYYMLEVNVKQFWRRVEGPKVDHGLSGKWKVEAWYDILVKGSPRERWSDDRGGTNGLLGTIPSILNRPIGKIEFQVAHDASHLSRLLRIRKGHGFGAIKSAIYRQPFGPLRGVPLGP